MSWIYTRKNHKKKEGSISKNSSNRGENSRTVQIGGGTLKGSYCFPLMSKGERVIIGMEINNKDMIPRGVMVTEGE
jgi:hypothetical protein